MGARHEKDHFGDESQRDRHCNQTGRPGASDVHKLAPTVARRGAPEQRREKERAKELGRGREWYPREKREVRGWGQHERDQQKEQQGGRPVAATRAARSSSHLTHSLYAPGDRRKRFLGRSYPFSSTANAERPIDFGGHVARRARAAAAKRKTREADARPAKL
jgi:hypothetical protein